MSELRKRPIDRLRDSAVSMAIDSPDDQSGIVATFEIDSRLCMVTGRGVYALQLADQTDPGRTNAAIRNSMQRLLTIGADNVIVSRILLTAESLCKAAYLGPAFPEKRAVALAWQQTKTVAAMAKMVTEFEDHQKKIMSEFDATKMTATQITLPTMEDAEHRFDAFAQKLGHAVNTLQELARLFYPELTSKWIDALVKLTVDRYGADAAFTMYIGEVGKTLLFMRDLRNMVEHPKPGLQAKVFDFRQIPTGEILVPSVEFEGSPYGTLPNALHPMMVLLRDGITLMTEQLIGHLCNSNLKPLAGFKIRVVTLPAEECGESNVRLSYEGYRDGQYFRCG
jgi:hypothetical protein